MPVWIAAAGSDALFGEATHFQHNPLRNHTTNQDRHAMPLPRRLRYAILGAVVAAAAVGNFLGPGLFYLPSEDNRLFEFTFGLLFAEVFLVTVGSVFAAQPALLRLPVGLGLLIFLNCFFVMGVQYFIGSPPGMGLAMILVSLILYAGMHLPLWCLRAILQQRIDLPAAASTRSPAAWKQFGLRYLLGATAGIGVLLALIKQVTWGNQSTRNLEWVEMLTLFSLLTLYASLVCLPCVGLLLSQTRWKVWAVSFVAICLAAPPIFKTLIASNVENLGLSENHLQFIYLLGGGAVGLTLLTLGIVRALAYRLVSPRQLPEESELP